MAEGIFKKLIGRKIFVQSAGIFDTLEIDGFTVKVCNEINVKLLKNYLDKDGFNQNLITRQKEIDKFFAGL